MRRTRSWIGLALLAFAGFAMASGTAEVRKQVEASMLLTGTIDIEPDGSVAGYDIVDADKVPDYVLANVAKQVPHWRFEPVLVDGRAVRARSPMNIRMLAMPAGDDMLVSIASASFGEYDPEATDRVTSVSLRPPRYPLNVLQLGGQGDVYLLVKVGRDGNVLDVAAEQVNLRVIGNPRQMESMRESLANAAIRAARSWTFRPPSAGDGIDEPHWVVRVPVDFSVRDQRQPGYGAWQGYVPGPRQRPDWITEDDGGNDALVAGGVYPVGATGGIRLLTPLGQG